MYVVKSGCIKLPQNGEILELFPGDVCIFNIGETQKPVENTECTFYLPQFSPVTGVSGVTLACIISNFTGFLISIYLFKRIWIKIDRPKELTPSEYLEKAERK